MRQDTLRLALALALVLALIGWAVQRRAATVAERRAHVAQAAADSLRRRGDSLRVVYQTDTVRLTRWRTRWDSITGPGVVDTVPVEVIIQVADSTIQACTLALRTCEQRVAVERERGDSLQSAADQWRKVARGPWLVPRVEATLTGDLVPQVAGEVTLGRGRVKGLARVEVGEAATARFGLVWTP